ncbi:Ubiquitin-conjugating enzyme E2 2 domain protein [Aspergillus niger]|uniref:Zinc transporter n=1 Tax=Aspergillus niger TaxID=5061 RepID=A0A505HYN7_ASPNG|nr:Ubiquitin-conjugating enzyme E2 2 domain protein [Aspergillus niger]
MSTGAPVSTVDTIPQVHGLGHSRGRGHSRASRRSNGPISISASSFDASSAQQQPPQPLPTTQHTNGQTEVLSGLLLSLPWIILSWYHQQHALWQTTFSTSDETAASSLGSELLEQAASKTSMLTAVTMIVYGCGQLFRSIQRGGSDSEVTLPRMSSSAASAALLRVSSVALPIYATLKVGGFLVACGLLLPVASGLPTVIQGYGLHSSAQSRLSQKKVTAMLLVTIIALSLWGMNATRDPHPYLGYVSLLTSVFVLRLPFSGTPSASADLDYLTSNGAVSQKQSTKQDSGKLSSSDSILAVLSGIILALVTVVVSGNVSLKASNMMYQLAAAGALATSLIFVSPSHLRSPQKIGLMIGVGAAALLSSPPLQEKVHLAYVARAIATAASFLAARFDDRQMRLSQHSHTHNHHHHAHSGADATKITRLIIQYSEPYPLLYSILKESDSRRIFYFMSLNFAFMLVQLSYGFMTGSLGLLSDSIHMFFDCLALVVGLCAAVMSKWPPSSRFPYGYGKVDTLSGFANGIFLMIISIEIIYEAVERLSSGSQMHRLGELLANMHGIFLHILADTLGSVAVVISTILVHYSGWPGFDPIASCLIAILIFASAIPLVSSTAKTLLLTLPADIEYNVRETLAGVSTLRGVVGSDLEDVRQRTVDYLREKGMDILVQVEREGDGRCWCGGGGNKHS